MIYVHIISTSMYNYAFTEMENMYNATFPSVLHGTIAKSRIDENIYNVMSQLVESNFDCLFVCLFEYMLYVPINSNCHILTLPPFYGT